MSTHQPRQPKGQPAGGQFAAKTQSQDTIGDLNDSQEQHENTRLAEGQLKALTAGHICGPACTSTVIQGGQERQLTCPYKQLDPTSPKDQKIIGSIYASEALAAMEPKN